MGDARGNPSTRFVAGDALRGIAALAVLVHHAAFGAVIATTGIADTTDFSASYGPVAGPFLRGLDLGLFIFFVLSGYLLGRPFIVALVERRPLPRVGRYAASRVLRIVPAFWVVVTVVLLYHGSHGASPLEIGAIYGFAQVHVPSEVSAYVLQAWTLGVEMTFYAALPIAALALLHFAPRVPRRSARIAVVAGLIALVGVASLAARLMWPESETIVKAFPGAVVAFVPGLLLATVEVALAPRLHGRRVGQVAALALLAAAAVLVVAHAATSPFSDGRRAALAMLAAGACVAAPLVWQWSTGRAWRVLDNETMNWLGERSYGIYLWHVAIGFAITDELADRDWSWGVFAVTLIVVLPLTILAAELSWRLVERPALSVRARLGRGSGSGPALRQGEAAAP